MSRPSPRARLVNGLLVLLAFGLLGWSIWANRGPIQDVLRRRPDLRLLGVAFGVYMVAILLTFFRWFVLVRALGLAFRLRDAFLLGFIGNVFNLVIPGAVGGDVIKAAYLFRLQARKTQAIGSMVIDRAVGLLGLFLLGGLAGLGAWRGAGTEVRALIAVVWSAVAAGGVGLAVLFTPALYRRLTRLVSGRIQILLNELVAMASIYRERIGVVFGTLALSSGIHALFVLAFFLVGRALFGAQAPALLAHYLVVPLVLFTTAAPLPFGALGLTEHVSDQLFSLVAHPAGAVAMMGFRVLMYGGGLVSACVYLANLRQARMLSAEQESGAATTR